MKRAIIVSSTFLLLVAVILTAWFVATRSRNRCDYATYFPSDMFAKRTNLSARLGEYYSAMQEAPFSCLDSRTEAYRLLVVPSGDSPASIRVWGTGTDHFIAIKRLTLDGPPHYGAKDLKVNDTHRLTDTQWNRLKELLGKASFWTLRPEDDHGVPLDGITVVLEGHENKNYHAIARWSQPDETLMNVNDWFFDLARLQWKR